LADYRDHYEEIRAAGADVVAISVDRPEHSERLRRDLNLPFAILSDVDRRLVKALDIFNPREFGGIAKPAVLIIDTNRTVLFSSVDGVRSRMGASDIARMLRARTFAPPAARRAYTPRVGDVRLSLRNLLGR
jgi:peroxiredoxin